MSSSPSQFETSHLPLIRVASQWGVRAVWFGYVCFLFTMTHISIPKPVATATSGWDKPLHLGAYFVLAVLTALVCMKTNPFRVSHLVLIPVLMAFAALDEILQGPVGRHPDLIDWFSDCVGIILGLLTVQLLIWSLKTSGWASRNSVLRKLLQASRRAEVSGFSQ